MFQVQLLPITTCSTVCIVSTTPQPSSYGHLPFLHWDILLWLLIFPMGKGIQNGIVYTSQVCCLWLCAVHVRMLHKRVSSCIFEFCYSLSLLCCWYIWYVTNRHVRTVTCWMLAYDGVCQCAISMYVYIYYIYVPVYHHSISHPSTYLQMR